MIGQERFYFRSPALTDYWRGIVLFGRNVASYKFALAKTLLELKPAAGTLIKLGDLAEPFSRYVCEHLKLADRQGTSASSRFLSACRGFNAGSVRKEDLLIATERFGFNNVIDAFHVVNQADIPKRFFADERESNGGIRLTDEFSDLLQAAGAGDLQTEAEARWRLVETAWDLGVTRHALLIQTDPTFQELFAWVKTSRRVSVTSCRAALNGYQKGRCFYCFRGIDMAGATDVDHFFPHVLRERGIGRPIDGVWNLVLACFECNRGEKGKFARVPSERLLARLHLRNEFLIASHHPLRETLMAQTGAQSGDRREFLQATYQAALDALLSTWEPQLEAPDPYRLNE